MNTSDAGLALIKSSEGFAAHEYMDNGVPAIGYGHRLQPGDSFPNGVTQAEADELLRGDLARYEVMLNERVPPGCTQNQYDALASFCYNVRNQPHSLDQLLAHGWAEVPAQLLRWCHELVDGQWIENPGLKARREREAALFSGEAR